MAEPMGQSESNPTPRGPARSVALPLDDRTYDRALACVHCGLCLPACPTYATNGLEADSPRGRIYLMRAMADGRIEPTDSVVEHLDLCLDCRACETACPSGVIYHELIEATRAHLEATRKRTFGERMLRWMLFHVMAHRTRLKAAMLGPRLMQQVGLWRPMSRMLGKVLPGEMAKMQQMLPEGGPVWPRRLAERHPAKGEAKRTVAFLAGCAGEAMYNHVHRQCIEVLQHLGCTVLVPRRQVCCGAIHHHGGRPGEAASMARQNITAFGEADHIVTDIAGCGAMLKEYDHLLRDDPEWAEPARRFTERARDVNELIAELLEADDAPRPTHAIRRTVTYHDACHLAHAQKITAAPRRLLALIQGLNVVDLPESEMCCGAAGTYNLEQPEMARQLAERKLEHIRSTGSDLCVTANVGCAMQIESEARRLGQPLTVRHPVELLHEAYFGIHQTSG